ncbi:spoIIIJ-associated protein [Peptoclostridium litorale DSM 5388]|uniref:RNA-binding protein KhpB n=1 Tax=Peptoclostridium litorale DSM 5388 TaxID=1121324 RepID=A0A069RQC5_PEPLI|nr:RNA-binding cell elongation regulator Jag/EloR [Peptoclostridium litorale]KDR96377.1 protein Jag [Peptoclostridium litorale DSM 5388]SIO27233.1 spoIIIJ-associated protein [Peptoclostridium litorale DSM 5388]
MRFVESTGKTIEEALGKALEELKATLEEVEYEVLEEPTKGFLGLIGGKAGRIKVTLKDRSGDIARGFINEILNCMDVDLTPNIEKDGSVLNIRLDGDGNQMGHMIGRRGETLDALQFLTNLVVNKNSKEHVKVLMDVGDYREKREESLIRFSKKMARAAVKRKRPIKLEPMNPYERRIIHAALQSDPYVRTYSEGDEPNRRVVIAIKK